MLSELSADQIAAIGGIIIGVIGGLAEWARRSANKAVAPISNGNDNAGVALLFDPRRVELIISQLGVLEVRLSALVRAIETGVGSVDRNSDANDRVLKSVNRLNEAIDEARSDWRDQREEARDERATARRERDAVRDELRSHRDSEKP